MKNLYKPFKVKIVKIEKLSADTKLFRLKKKSGDFAVQESGLVFIPGQFVLASVFGYGEAPFGAASSPDSSSNIDIIVRKVGTLTDAMHQLKNGDDIFLRGPYGNGFPIDFMEDKDIVMVTGGCGLPPIAALAGYIIKRRGRFGKVHLVYGAGTPDDLLLKNRLKKWEEKIDVLLTIDKSAPEWPGRVGFVSEFVGDLEVSPQNTVVVMCGPQPMMNAVEKIMKPLGVSDRRIFVNMERRMQCGIGHCQHCVTGDKYVCRDGPVFSFDQIKDNWD